MPILKKKKYYAINVLLGAQEFGSVFDGEVIITSSDSCCMGEYPFGSAGGDWWVWVFC